MPLKDFEGLALPTLTAVCRQTFQGKTRTGRVVGSSRQLLMHRFPSLVKAAAHKLSINKTMPMSQWLLAHPSEIS